jgi:cardiolipin synthase
VVWEFITDSWDNLLEWLPLLIFFLNLLLLVGTLGWILMTKTDATSAVAWCLLVIFLPLVGAVVFYLLGYQHIHRPLKRKRRHKQLYRLVFPPQKGADSAVLAPAGTPRQKQEGMVNVPFLEQMARLADHFGAYPLRLGNAIEFYEEGAPAYEAMLKAIAGAKHHIHLETFIFQPDGSGERFLQALTAKACEGVQVRLLYDAFGSHRMWRKKLQDLKSKGGKCSVFLPMNPFRRRLQINMRNHRKILVVDGQVGFVGGLNIGDEYLGLNPRFGFWRDTHLRLEGPAVHDLQRIFAEDWDFAAAERISDATDPGPAPARGYYVPHEANGPYPVQILESGPDRELKGIREIYFAAILKARDRVWIASPYFVPDAGLRDALRLAGHLGVDVRLLCQYHPDKWIPQYAARYYWAEMLEAGVKVYQYTKGMMHAKVVIVDGQWASVGTANLDNRSLHLNFEVNCLMYSPEAAARLEAAFEEDLAHAIRLDRGVYARRPFAGRLLENACRLMSPVL